MNTKLELEKAKRIWESTSKTLKNFQLKTIDRVIELFLDDKRPKRVLVADEVGLGKTFIAKGVIDKLRIAFIESGKESFKVAYVCSNQAIALQNVKKLIYSENLSNEARKGNKRLSMQHILISEEKLKTNKPFTTIFPMSPTTSFKVAGYAGLIDERALIYTTLDNAHFFDDFSDEDKARIFEIFKCGIKYDFNLKDFQNRIKEIEDKTNERPYLNTYLINHRSDIEDCIKKFNLSPGELVLRENKMLISKLRGIFSEIGAEMLDVDLIIMDEFQRFAELLDFSDMDNQSEAKILAKKFFQDREDRHILLLSATPYKPYQNSYDVENSDNVSFKEFVKVTDFVANNKSDFQNSWRNYNRDLKKIDDDGFDFEKILSSKQDAEDKLYKLMCRTERLSVNLPKTTYKTFDEGLLPTQDDVKSYLDAHNLLKSYTNIDQSELRTIYSQNIPYLFSYLKTYEIGKKLEKEQVSLPKCYLKTAAVPWNKINHFESIDFPSAKMRKALEVTNISSDDTVIPYLLWIPPTFPYYQLGYPFNKAEGYSKTLIFSSWKMVPRCVSSLFSYEADRKVNDFFKANKFAYKSIESGTRKYSDDFYFQIRDSKVLATLLYPSRAGYDVWNNLNKKPSTTLEDFKQQIKPSIENYLKQLIDLGISDENCSEEDMSWKKLALPLIDYYLLGFTNIFDSIKSTSDLKEPKEAMSNLYSELLSITKGDKKLGKMPSDLVDFVVKLVIGSPAICTLRSLKNANGFDTAFKISVTLFQYLYNGYREGTCILNALYRKSVNIDYCDAILDYSIAGCFQAVMDEYVYMLVDGNYDKNCLDEIIGGCVNAGTIELFGIGDDVQHNLKCKFAMSFANDLSSTENEKGASRTSNVRLAFNSPFRPFILASTSLGQEGLDFHNYCRKIIHWNVPTNPVDFEQREGRIDRYKSLYIRQNIANKYKNEEVSGDVWPELFKRAVEDVSIKDRKSGLVPYWCLTDDFIVDNHYSLEKYVLFFKYSIEEQRYKNLLQSLTTYRYTIGHPKQEELLEKLMKIKDEDKRSQLYLNLSPWSKSEKKDN